MRGAVQSAVGAAQICASAEILERKLMELRAEIDAFLTQLAGQRAAFASIEAPVPPQAEDVIAEPPATEGLIEEIEAQTQIAGEIEEASDAQQLLADPTDVDPIASDVPEEIAIMAATSEPASIAPDRGDDLATNATSDGRATVEQHGAAMLSAVDAEQQNAQAPTAEAVAEPTVAIATTGAPAADLAPDAAPQPVEIPAAASSPSEAATLIAFEPRQRKEKAAAVISTMPARRARKVMRRVAAGIVALIAAATALVVADRTAVMSAQSLPWMSPLPSYMPRAMSWPFSGEHKRADWADAGGHRAAASVTPAESVEVLLTRYREIWPAGP